MDNNDYMDILDLFDLFFKQTVGGIRRTYNCQTL